MTILDPLFVSLLIFSRAHEVFHLHLLELARSENKIAGRHFITKRFSDLRDAERQFAAARCQHVEEVYEDALRGFRPQIHERCRIVFRSRTNMRAEHQVERSRLGEVCRATVWTFDLLITNQAGDVATWLPGLGRHLELVSSQ